MPRLLLDTVRAEPAAAFLALVVSASEANVASESWWRDPQLLRALLDRPFSLDDMDHAIPYKLAPQQAVSFYFQSALTVDCLLRTRSWNLRQLFDALRAGSHADSISYDLPELAQASFLSACAASLGR